MSCASQRLVGGDSVRLEWKWWVPQRWTSLVSPSYLISLYLSDTLLSPVWSNQLVTWRFHSYDGSHERVGHDQGASSAAINRPCIPFTDFSLFLSNLTLYLASFFPFSPFLLFSFSEEHLRRTAIWKILCIKRSDDLLCLLSNRIEHNDDNELLFTPKYQYIYKINRTGNEESPPHCNHLIGNVLGVKNKGGVRVR